MKKTPDVSDEDKALFRASVSGTQPLSQNKIILKPNKAIKIKAPKTSFKQIELTKDEAARPSSTPSTAEGQLFYTRAGLQTRLLQKFRRGQIAIEDTLDLHGLTSTQAEQVVLQFLQRAIHKQQRCVLLIHGKGYTSQANYPVLKNQVAEMLKQYREVLAYCSAKAQHGGTGAIYVLLKTSAWKEKL